MGVVNVTPDSFSDGGLFADANDAVVHAARLVDEGADLIDVGGESTRPGADPLPVDEELARVIAGRSKVSGRHARRPRSAWTRGTRRSRPRRSPPGPTS